VRSSVLALAAAVALSLSACDSPGAAIPGASSAAPTTTTSPAPSPGADEDAIRVAIVGDSITDVASENFSLGEIDSESWASEVLGDGRVFAGGWAVWGATTEQMAHGVDDWDADVLLILAGTNDVGLGIPFEETPANLAAIVETVRAPRVVVSAIPPMDWRPGINEQFNRSLKRFVLEQGWEWVDPMGEIESAGRFRPGMTADGIHPTAKASRLIGEAIEAAVFPEDAAD